LVSPRRSSEEQAIRSDVCSFNTAMAGAQHRRISDVVGVFQSSPRNYDRPRGGIPLVGGAQESLLATRDVKQALVVALKATGRPTPTPAPR
jgi:hypothetical protein